jgi:hypothetical protein
MKIIGYKEMKGNRVELLFDKLEIKYPDLYEIGKDERFREIARKFNLTSLTLRNPISIRGNTLDLCAATGPENDFGEQVFFIELWKNGLIVNTKETYWDAVLEIFNFVTGQDLKLLVDSYAKEKVMDEFIGMLKNPFKICLYFGRCVERGGCDDPLYNSFFGLPFSAYLSKRCKTFRQYQSEGKQK